MPKPADSPAQDRRLGLPRETINGRFVTKYDPGVALVICERVASGETLKEICTEENRMPHRSTFHRWVVNNPKLALAYNAARELSASSLEEEAILAAREVKARARQVKSPEVQAYNAAMTQFRWSAERRDPARFGSRTNVNVTVPIQINSTLDLSSEGSGTKEHPNIYEVEAQVPASLDPGDDPDLQPIDKKISLSEAGKRGKAAAQRNRRIRIRKEMDRKAKILDEEMKKARQKEKN